MAAGAGDGSGTAGGTDLEPLRGGMREQEEGRTGPGHAGDRGSDEPSAPRREAAPPGTQEDAQRRGEPEEEGAAAPDDAASRGSDPSDR